MEETKHSELNSYRKSNLLNYCECPIRGEISLPDYKPEEKVRLTLLNYLVNLTELYPEKIDLFVEIDRYDISIYNKLLGDISSYQPPILIVETKREDLNLINAFNQIVEYLKSSKTENGLLFNQRSCFHIYNELNIFKTVEINYYFEIENIINSSLINQSSKLEEEKSLFDNAKKGDFEAFKVLSLKYRRNKIIVFTVNFNAVEYTIEGHLFEFELNIFKFTKCGYDSKAINKPSYKNVEFLRLDLIKTG